MALRVGRMVCVPWYRPLARKSFKKVSPLIFYTRSHLIAYGIICFRCHHTHTHVLVWLHTFWADAMHTISVILRGGLTSVKDTAWRALISRWSRAWEEIKRNSGVKVLYRIQLPRIKPTAGAENTVVVLLLFLVLLLGCLKSISIFSFHTGPRI